MDLLKVLNEKNDMKIYSVFDEEFKSFGRVIDSYDFSEAIDCLNKNTEIGEANAYVASFEPLSALPVWEKIEASVYGGMPIQVGYCNGKNSTFNGFEYHKGSEINVAANDICLSLGHCYDIKNNFYNNDDAKVFFVPKGTAIEMYQTTLHLAPLKVRDEGYRVIVVLPLGTNTPLSDEQKAHILQSSDLESALLLQKNKWVIAHPDREPLISQGAVPGIIGENIELKY